MFLLCATAFVAPLAVWRLGHDYCHVLQLRPGALPVSKGRQGKAADSWKQHISRDDGIHDGDRYLCTCGAVIGRDAGRKINLERGNTTTAGTALR